MMKAVVTEKYGPSEVMDVRETEKPVPGPRQALVRVRASSVNPIDWKIRSGSLKLISGRRPPRILGGDFAGLVVETGSDAPTYKAGDEVFGLKPALKGGAYAQYIAVQDQNLAPKPENLSFEEAAAIPLAGLTAYQALVHKAGVTSGNHVMVNGCSGGVGIYAVQIAKALGCHVTGVCSERNIQLAIEIGADSVIDYGVEDVLKDKDSYDLFFDAVGNQSFSKAKATLKAGGAYVTTLPTAHSMLAGPVINLLGPVKYKSVLVGPNAKDLAVLADWATSERLKPVVDKVFTLEEIREAHDYSQTGRAAGKIVLTIA